MLESVLLRFRDHQSGIDTIREHDSLIVSYGYTWWGWWRKASSEPDRKEEIEELAARAKRSPITIGLFDRSTDRYFMGSASDIIRNEISNGTPERRKTPEYYAGSKTVEAWFRLNSIEPVTKSSFLRQFGIIPESEHTFFPLETGRAYSAATPESFLNLKSNFVVHISDIHFGADHGFPLGKDIGRESVIARLREDIERNYGGEIGALIVSGDISSRGDANALIVEGLNFLNACHTELRVPKEAIFVVPGNHDFQLLNYRPTDFAHERPFNMMLSSFYGNYDPDQKFRRVVFPSGQHVEFLLINSVRLRKVEEANYGYVEWSLYENRFQSRQKVAEVTRVAVLHHHLASMPREEHLDEQYPHAGISTTIDSGAVIEGLQSHGFRLAMHGHQHVPGIARISRGVIDGNSTAVAPEDLTILSAGSAGAKVERLSDSMRDNSYNILNFERRRISIEARRFNPGAIATLYFQSQIQLN